MLILTEKPNVAKSFSVALNIPRNNFGYYDDGTTVITNCRGHLFELSMPEDYDPKYKKWSFSNLPIIPSKYTYQRIADSSSQTSIVLKLLKQHKNDKIIIATDADREGEVIARIVMSEAGITDISNCFRFWISATLTKESILQAMKNMKAWNTYNELAAKGLARQHADWLVGMNLSPYITLLSGSKTTFSVGRVQTAILAAIAQRNNEVKNFISTPYYECIAHLKDNDGNKVQALLINPDTNKTNFLELNHYINTAHSFSETNKSIQIETKVERKTLAAPHLLNLTDLSIIASREFDLQPSQVERIAEKLYNDYKCLSYPRTPSTVMGENEEDVKTFQEKFNIIKSKYEISKYCDEKLISITNKKIFNDKKLEGHYALIPFGLLPAEATVQEKNIYDTVVKYFLMSCMPPCIYDEKTLLIHNGEYTYKTKTKTIVTPGFKEAEKNETEKDELIIFNEKTCILKNTEIVKKLTSPKKEFTEASILEFMKNPSSANEENCKLIGIGTETTRGAILQKLFTNNYLVKEKKKLYATDKGVFLLKQLFKNELAKKIAGISQTTQWEKQLESSPEQFEKDIVQFIRECVSIRPEIESYEKTSIGICPLCKNKIMESKVNYFCIGYKNEPKCNFAIWKTFCDARITVEDAKLLLEGKTTKSKNMKSKAGKEFSAKLKLNSESKKIELVFEQKKSFKKQYSR